LSWGWEIGAPVRGLAGERSFCKGAVAGLVLVVEWFARLVAGWGFGGSLAGVAPGVRSLRVALLPRGAR